MKTREAVIEEEMVASDGARWKELDGRRQMHKDRNEGRERQNGSDRVIKERGSGSKDDAEVDGKKTDRGLEMEEVI